MTDIALLWDNAAFAADIALDGLDLATDGGLRTALIISLFTDARARDDDELPQPGADRRGWWGNLHNETAGDEIGSRLWLLSREKVLATVVNRARDYAREAVQWLIRDGIARAIDVEAEAQRVGDVVRLAFAIHVTRPTGPARQRFDLLWEASA